MPTFSLKWLLAAVAFVALACVALLHASPLWGACAYAVALLLMLAAPVCVFYRREARRAFWVGFAVFGWGFFALLAMAEIEALPEDCRRPR